MKCIVCSNPTKDNTTLPEDHSLCDECFFNAAIEGPTLSISRASPVYQGNQLSKNVRTKKDDNS